MADDLTAQIGEARKHNYSDADIVNYLSTSKTDLAPKIKTARSNGYSDADIVSFLSKSAALAAPKYTGRPIDFLLSHNVKRTPIEEQAVQERLHARQGQGIEELGGALMLPLGAEAVAAGKGIPAVLGSMAYKGAGGAIGGAAGYEAGSRGAKMLGLSPEVATTIGMVASLLGARIGMKLSPGDVGAFLEETESPTIGKFLRWMKMRGKAVPEAPETFKPSQTTARQMKYGGETEPEYSPAKRPIPKRIAGKPARRLAELTPEGQVQAEAGMPPKAPKPFKPSAAVARKMKYGGPVEPEYGPAPAGGRGAAHRISRAVQTEEPAAETTTQPATETAPIPQAKAGSPTPTGPAGRANVLYEQGLEKNRYLAARFKGQGLTPEQVEIMPNSRFEMEMMKEGQSLVKRGLRSRGFSKYAGRPQQRPYNIMKIEIADEMRRSAGGK